MYLNYVEEEEGDAGHDVRTDTCFIPKQHQPVVSDLNISVSDRKDIRSKVTNPEKHELAKA